jgi:pentatricopeptide repeat protein
MARRAVQVLDDIVSGQQFQPQEAHYTATVWACANSDMYDSAVEIFSRMREQGVAPTTSTYEALVSVAERSGKYEETIRFLEVLSSDGMTATTELYNSCMWACDSAAHPELALQLLDRMQREGVARDITTFEAAMWACEKKGDSESASHVLGLMAADGCAPNTIMLRAAMWAHVKGGQPAQALKLFDSLSDSQYGVRKDSGCYNAAIWACERVENPQRSVQLLRLMKMEGFKRSTISYDGALSALSHAGDGQQCLEVVKWMARESPEVKKSPVTYKVVVDALDNAGMAAEAMRYYQDAARDGYFVPWVEGTRTLDFRGFSFSVAKVATISVLQSMKGQSMNLFALDVIVGDILQDEGEDEEDGDNDEDFAAEMAFTEGTKFGVLDMDSGSAGVPDSRFEDARGKSATYQYQSNCLYVDKFIQWLQGLRPREIGEDCGDYQAAKLSPVKYAEVEEGTYHVRISRDDLETFFESTLCDVE